MATFVMPAQVRDYLNITATTGQYSNELIGSNINAASAFLQRRTSRQFEFQGSNTSKTFTTEGRAYLTIPDLRVANSVTLQDSTLTANESYYLIPDRMNTGVFTAIQFRAFGTYNYRSNPQWFDRNLDSWLYSRVEGSLPNDLVIVGEWGHVPLPSELLHATVVLASYFTKRPDSVLSGGIQTPEGGIFDLSALPVEVTTFIDGWKLGEQLVGVS
jgi:hypothetical protein